MIPLTERLLNDAGGWQAMKAARGLHAAGRVNEATYEPPILRGLVREGNTEYRAGLRIGSKTDIENLCTCRESRGRGLICAHSLAVGLAVLQPIKAPPVATPAAAPAPPEDPDRVKASGGTIFSTTTGEDVTLHFIVPPKFAETWDRGVSLVAEAIHRAGRTPLGALKKGGSYRCAGDDLAALRAILKLSGGELPAMLALNANQADQVFASLVAHPRITLGRGKNLQIGREGRTALSATTAPGGTLRLTLRLPAGCRALAGTTAAWIWNPADSSLNRTPDGLPAAYLALFQQPFVEIPAEGVDGFLRSEAGVLARFFEIQGLPSPDAVAAIPREVPVFFLKIEGSLNYLAAELESRLGQRRATLTGPGTRPTHPAEQAALARLRQCGFEPGAKGEWALRGENATLGFFARQLPELQRDWEVTVGSRFETITENFERVHPHLEIQGSGQNWFEVGFELATDSGERLSAQDIRRLLATGKRTAKLKNNRTVVLTTDMLDDFEQVLRDTNPGQSQPGVYRFDQRDAASLKTFADHTGGEIAGHAGTPDWNKSLPFSHDIPPLDLGDLGKLLRGYQTEGTNWLNRLYKNGLSGILSDEMGLGKTLQALAFLQSLQGPKLVVCPASLTINWEREALRFTPGLRPVRIAELAPDAVASAVRERRLLITSYGLLRRDIETLRSVHFNAIVLDEAQNIKNPDSQTARAAHRLQADGRIAITGTPIENGVRDIWSIMEFLMRGYLGKREDFRERFELPIRNHPGGSEHRRLTQRLRPFMLRRTKREVAKELPDKIEQVSYVELTRKQQSLYGNLLSAARKTVQDARGEGAKSKSRLAAFTALLRLRQICCDPRLLDLGESAEAEDAAASAKLELLLELLSEAIEDGHRVLVFSQFATMLGLIREALQAQQIDHCHLDGATRDRQAQVDRFQTGEVPVFLISLKAGGVGLNLTAADTVIHFDPWWNPAVENQATDRAHRIGQERTVNVYKLIARGTVEEKILQLQQKKREMIDSLVDSESPLMTGLTFEDIQDLVQ